MMSKKIKILFTSDVHGTILPVRCSDQKEESMGLAKIAVLFDNMRDENTLCIDNGDLIQGSPMAFYFNYHYPNAISPITKAIKVLNYDYLNLGNHDFNFGIDPMRRHLEESKIPCLTNNIQVRGQDLAPLYRIHEFPNGVRIALFGIATHFISQWENPKTLLEMDIQLPLVTATKAVEAIRQHETVDLIVGVYHGGFERDLETGVPTEKLTGENIGYELCEKLGLDILLTGHQHRSLAGKCLGTVVAQTAQNGREVGYIEFDVDTKEADVKLLTLPNEVNQTIVDSVKELDVEFQAWLDQPLGKADRDLKVMNQFDARLHKHPIVSFMNQVQLNKTGADFSAVALFNEAAGFNQEITMRDIVSTYVYSNTLCVLEMSGHTLKKFLERCADYFSINDQGEICPDESFVYPKPVHFNYDMVDGLEYTIEVANPKGERITSMSKDGVQLDLDKRYTLATGSYRASGSGNFDMLEEATRIYEGSDEMVDLLAQYILDHPNLKVDHKDNILVK